MKLRWTTYFLFFLFNLLISSYFLDNWRNPNSTSRVLQTRSLIEDGVLNIDKFQEETIDKSLVHGHYYSDKAPLPSLLLYPIYKAGMSLGVFPDPSDDQGDALFLIGSFLFGSLAFALVIQFAFARLINAGINIKKAMLLSSLPFYGSFIFIYSGTFYSHVFSAFLLVWALNLIEGDRGYFPAGLLTGAAFFNEYLVAIFGLVWFFQIWRHSGMKNTVFFGLGLLPFVLSFFVYNYTLTGHILKTPYAHQVYYDMDYSIPSIRAIIMMMISPWRGLIFYLPIVLAFVPLIWRHRKKKNPIVLHYALLPSILFYLAVSAFNEWPGGWTFGPRYLIPAAGLIVFYFLPELPLSGKKSLWTWVPISLGILLSLPAKLTVQYSIPSSVKFPWTEIILPYMTDGKWMDTGIIQRIFNTSAAFSCLMFTLLLALGLCLVLFIVKDERQAKEEGTSAKNFN